MSGRGKAKRWLFRVSVITVILAGIGIFADPGQARAEAVGEPLIDDATWAVLVFALVWVLASLRIRRTRGRLRLGFEPAAVRMTSGTPKSGGRSARASGGSSGGAGASGNF